MLTIVHPLGKGEIRHLVMEVNQDYLIVSTQEECPYWNRYQKDCDTEEILRLDYNKLLKLLEDRGLKPKVRK